jgi:hypothetical protein
MGYKKLKKKHQLSVRRRILRRALRLFWASGLGDYAVGINIRSDRGLQGHRGIPGEQPYPDIAAAPRFVFGYVGDVPVVVVMQGRVSTITRVIRLRRRFMPIRLLSMLGAGTLCF